MDTQTKIAESKDLKIPHGALSIIANRVKCSPGYVYMVLKGQRRQNTVLAHQIIDLFEIVTGQTYPKSTN